MEDSSFAVACRGSPSWEVPHVEEDGCRVVEHNGGVHDANGASPWDEAEAHRDDDDVEAGSAVEDAPCSFHSRPARTAWKNVAQKEGLAAFAKYSSVVGVVFGPGDVDETGNPVRLSVPWPESEKASSRVPSLQ